MKSYYRGNHDNKLTVWQYNHGCERVKEQIVTIDHDRYYACVESRYIKLLGYISKCFLNLIELSRRCLQKTTPSERRHRENKPGD